MMKAVESLNQSTKRPYEPPRLIRQGHMSQVTKKSGPQFDNSPQWETGKRKGKGEPPTPQSGSSDEIFDNIFDD